MRRAAAELTAPISNSTEGQAFCEAALSPSTSSNWVALMLGSLRGSSPTWTRALGSSAPAVTMPRGRWYLKLRPTRWTPLASSAAARLSPARPR